MDICLSFQLPAAPKIEFSPCDAWNSGKLLSAILLCEMWFYVEMFCCIQWNPKMWAHDPELLNVLSFIMKKCICD